MYQKERIDKITELLKLHGYVTVKFLTKELDYSTATINRDLNLMEKQKLVKRTYGGVELLKRKGVSLAFRYDLMKTAKNKLGIIAASLVKDGDVVFIDASTTAEFIGKHLTEKKNITVITNNMALSVFLSKQGVEVITLGGTVCEKPYMLSGNITVSNAMQYNADICFFSTGGLTREGVICDNDLYFMLHEIMVKNSKKSYYMADHEKIDVLCTKNLFDLNSLSGIITDYSFDDSIKKMFPDTEFLEIE